MERLYPITWHDTSLVALAYGDIDLVQYARSLEHFQLVLVDDLRHEMGRLLGENLRAMSLIMSWKDMPFESSDRSHPKKQDAASIPKPGVIVSEI